MNLSELYAQHERELQQYKEIRQQVWERLQKEHQELLVSFGGVDRLPSDIQKRINKQNENYNLEWAEDSGERYQELQRNHIAQRQSIAGPTLIVNRYEEIREQSPVDKNAQRINESQKAMLDKIAKAQENTQKQPDKKNKTVMPSKQELEKIIAQQKAMEQRKQTKKRAR